MKQIKLEQPNNKCLFYNSEYYEIKMEKAIRSGGLWFTCLIEK